MLRRKIDVLITRHFRETNLILLLFGARQVGKTTLIRRIFPNAFYLLADNQEVYRKLEAYDIASYLKWLPKNREIIIDEIHLLSDPGRCAKILFDQIPNIKLIITGSSSLHIKNKTSESLAGRFRSYQLHSLSYEEFLNQKGIADIKTDIVERSLKHISQKPKSVYLFNSIDVINNLLIYGSYPYLVHHSEDVQYLTDYVNSTIFKDIIELNLIEDRSTALSLLKLLSYQIGNLINYADLARILGIDQRTVKRYIDIFEESYIVYRLFPFSKNERSTIKKTPKIYFYDTGIRNALINNFASVNERTDIGALFENFVIGEFVKANAYNKERFRFFYWRTKSGSEVDLVIIKDEKLTGIEIKYNQQKINSSFKIRYPEASLININRNNFFTW